MRTVAILSAVIIGAIAGAVGGTVIDLAVAGGDGTIGAIGVPLGAIGLGWLTAHLVPRSERAQQRHDRAVAREYPNRIVSVSRRPR